MILLKKRDAGSKVSIVIFAVSFFDSKFADSLLKFALCADICPREVYGKGFKVEF